MENVFNAANRAGQFVSDNRQNINTGLEGANLFMNMHQSNYIRGREASRDRAEEQRRQDERELREEQRRQEIVERAENELATKLLEIYDNSKLLVKTHSLTDTEFSINVESFERIIESVITEQEDRYDALKREVEKWWTPCARSKAERINNQLKDKAEASIEYLKESLYALSEFASQEPGNCNYTPLKKAIENYNLSNSHYTWAKAIGLKAIDSKQLTDNSVDRAQSIIDHSDKVLMQFKDILNYARSTYAKKAVKAIYDGQDNNLNLSQFYLDKIVDLRKQGINIYKEEMEIRAARFEELLKECIAEQKQEDVRSIPDNTALYKGILNHLTSAEDLNKPDVKSLLDSIRLAVTIKNNVKNDWLNDLENQESLTLQSLSIQFSENNSQGVTILGSDDNSVEEVHNDFAD